jgi:type III pantothenate kinase
MLLAIDIGNTNTVIGLFDGERLIDHFRAASVHSLTVDECGFFVAGLLERLKFAPEKVSQVVIASVVPRLTPVYEGMSRKYFKQEPLVVSSKLNLPIKIGYHDPTAV